MTTSGEATNPTPKRRGAIALLSALLAATWVLWSGMLSPLLLGLGVASCVLTTVVAVRLGYFDTQVFALHFSVRLIRFWGWLAAEIVKSSIDVAKVVLSRDLTLATRVVRVDVSDMEPVDQAIFGNATTLTPGTLTLDVADGEMLVHALTEKGARSVEQGDAKRRMPYFRSA